MDLQSLFFISLSIFAIVATVTYISIILIAILVYIEAKRISKKLEVAANDSRLAAQKAQGYVDKIGRNIFEYIMLKIARGIINKRKE